MHVAVDPLRVAVTSALSRIRFRVAVSSSPALAAHAIFTEVEIAMLLPVLPKHTFAIGLLIPRHFWRTLSPKRSYRRRLFFLTWPAGRDA